MTTTPNLSKATDFIWRTARLLEQRRFAYLFLDGQRQAVLEALRPYQNPDSGFGNGLEPDIRGPVSQPVPTWTALCILDEAGAFADPLVTRACDYLLTITTPDGGVPFVLPSVRDYPRAPWWETGDQPPASLNPTAAIAGLLHKHRVEHPWLTAATEYCWRKLDEMERTDPYEMRAVLPFLDFVSDRQRAENVRVVEPGDKSRRILAVDRPEIDRLADQEGIFHGASQLARSAGASRLNDHSSLRR